ncbi:MAG: STAS domain-containing protein [Kurthia sp.]|nr:STAS domain-containing protein [Candidatus Kurthia equi]
MSNDTQEQIAELQKEINFYKSIISEMTVPLIETFVDNTLLVPLNDHLFTARNQAIEEKIVKYIELHHSIKIIIFDFTGITPKNIQFIDSMELSNTLEKLNKTLQMIGIRPIYSGFHPEVVLSLVSSGFMDELETYSSYKIAIHKVARDLNFVAPMKKIYD